VARSLGSSACLPQCPGSQSHSDLEKTQRVRQKSEGGGRWIEEEEEERTLPELHVGH